MGLCGCSHHTPKAARGVGDFRLGALLPIKLTNSSSRTAARPRFPRVQGAVPTYLLRRSLPRQGDSRAIAGCSSAGIRNRGRLPVGGQPRRGRHRWHASARRRKEMHPEDLMKPDLFSEIVLLGSGGRSLHELHSGVQGSHECFDEDHRRSGEPARTVR